MWTIILIIVAIYLIVGIIRVLCTPSEDFGDLIFNLFLLDFLGDFLIAVIDTIADSD